MGELEKRCVTKWQRLYRINGELILGQEIYTNKSYALTQKGSYGLVGLVELVEEFELLLVSPEENLVGHTVALAMDKYADTFVVESVDGNIVSLTNTKNGWRKTTYVERIRRLAKVS